MSLEVSGVITKVLPIQTGEKKDGSGEWQKQLFIVDNQAEYNNIFCFEIFGNEKVENFNKYNKVGDFVKVDFNVNTNEYQSKFFTTLSAWKVFKESAGSQNQEQFEPANDFEDQNFNDMPF